MYLTFHSFHSVKSQTYRLPTAQLIQGINESYHSRVDTLWHKYTGKSGPQIVTGEEIHNYMSVKLLYRLITEPFFAQKS